MKLLTGGAHWDLGGFDKFDHKSGVTQQISNYIRIGNSWIDERPVNALADNPTMFSWTDGTPVSSALNTPTGIFTSEAGNGFEITVLADTNLKTLKLYVGLWYAQGKLEATLSDGSALAYVDSSLNNNSGTSNGVYTIRFKAASRDQVLKIKYTVLTDYYAPYGNVTLEAATLR